MSYVVYMAHPVGAPTPAGVQLNLARAKRWLRWFYDCHPQLAMVANWMQLVELLDDHNPKHREIGMQQDLLVVERCDVIVLVGGVGGRISSGMLRESGHARKHGKTVWDLTALGPEPPALDDELSRFSIAGLLHRFDTGKEF